MPVLCIYRDGLLHGTSGNGISEDHDVRCGFSAAVTPAEQPAVFPGSDDTLERSSVN
jgi:hypothetical protein